MELRDLASTSRENRMAMRGGQGMDGGEEGCCKREDNKPKCEDRVDRVLLTLDVRRKSAAGEQRQREIRG